MRSKELVIYLLADNAKDKYNELILNWRKYFRVNVNYIKEKELPSLKKKRVDFLFVDEAHSTDIVNLELFNDIRDLNHGFKMIWSLSKVNDKAYKLLKFGADDILYYEDGDDYLKWKSIALLRRKWETHSNESVIFHRGLIVDFINQSVFINDKELELSKKEFLVLKYLLINHRYVSREELYKEVWKNKDEDSTRVVQQILQKIKTKIGFDYFGSLRNKGVKII